MAAPMRMPSMHFFGPSRTRHAAPTKAKMAIRAPGALSPDGKEARANENDEHISFRWRMIVRWCRHPPLWPCSAGRHSLLFSLLFALLLPVLPVSISATCPGFSGFLPDSCIAPAPLYRDLQGRLHGVHPSAETRKPGTCCVCCCRRAC
jgi:hypothetical protein